MFTVGDMLLRNSELAPNDIVLIDGALPFTCSETNALGNHVSHALLKLGLKHGDRVAILSRNCHQFLEWYFAIAKVGIVGVAINARFKPAEVQHYLNDSGTSALFVSEDFAELARKSLAGCPEV